MCVLCMISYISNGLSAIVISKFVTTTDKKLTSQTSLKPDTSMYMYMYVR